MVICNPLFLKEICILWHNLPHITTLGCLCCRCTPWTVVKSDKLTDGCSFFMLCPGGTQGIKHFPDRTDFKKKANNCCNYLSEKTSSRPNINTRHMVSIELCPATWGSNLVVNDKQEHGWCSVTQSEMITYQTLDLICTVLRELQELCGLHSF